MKHAISVSRIVYFGGYNHSDISSYTISGEGHQS